MLFLQLIKWVWQLVNLFNAIDVELFDFHIFRFSSGETTEEVARKRKSKS
jgi:hypothetical protein